MSDEQPDTTTAAQVAALRTLVQDQLDLSRRLRTRITELESTGREPLALVGIGLRMPGGVTALEGFWDLVSADSPPDVIATIPDDRPGLRRVHHPERGRAGHSYVDRAAFLTDAGQFDPHFWGISAREAEALDPQQRLLLETAWEAMEDAGVPADRAARRRAGVFVGMMTSEYKQRIVADGDLTRIDPYFGTGSGLSFAAGRVGYALGFSGPALTVDTACSSSLVAVHLASKSLRDGEIDLALVGGANLVLGAELMVSLSQTRALAPDGRSKTFLADADGYGRGEGVAMLALMRLSDAERGGHPIHAVIRGTAVNHDGAASGLTVPSGPAQQEVIRAALCDAGLDPADVGYVETHGTGTALGDPIEVTAIDEVLGTGAEGRLQPVVLGTLKSRIGHLEAAAGVASLIKAALVVGRGVIPSSTPEPDLALNPMVAWGDLGVEVPRHSRPWTSEQPRTAGVSAFGLSGTNAHIIVQQYAGAPVCEPASPAIPDTPVLLPVSAKSAVALRTLVDQVAAALDSVDEHDFATFAHTMRNGRAHHPFRTCVVAPDTGTAVRLLRGHQRQSASPAVIGPVALRLGPDESARAAQVASVLTSFPRLADELRDGAGLADLLHALGVPVRLAGESSSGVAEVSLGDRTVPLLGGDAAVESFLVSLGELYVEGIDLRFDLLSPPGQRLLQGLPGHPFLRRRYWIEESTSPVATGVVLEEAWAGDTALPREGRDDLESVLLEELRDIFKSPEPLERGLGFQDAGGDSFAAMMLAKSIEERHAVELDPDAFPLDSTIGGLVSSLAEQIRVAMFAQQEAS